MVVSMKNKVRTLFAVDAKHVQLCAVTNIFQEDARIFAAPGPAIVVIDFTTDMKRALITEIYGVQKFLFLYPLKRLHTEVFTNYLISIRKVLNDG
jgi:hypothetical protein